MTGFSWTSTLQIERELESPGQISCASSSQCRSAALWVNKIAGTYSQGVNHDNETTPFFCTMLPA